MKRDFNLIRKILLDVQSFPPNNRDSSLEYEGEYDKDIVNEHIELLIEAGLLKGHVVKSMNGILQIAVSGLTWDGHNFIDAARNDVIWKKAFDVLKDKGVDATFDVLKTLLGSMTLKAMGLT